MTSRVTWLVAWARYTATKNNKKLKSLYQKALQIKSAIPHPKIMGVIRECGGKMHMALREWEPARNDFFDAFKNYDEARVGLLLFLFYVSALLVGTTTRPGWGGGSSALSTSSSPTCS